jgi:hypothetical protein
MGFDSHIRRGHPSKSRDRALVELWLNLVRLCGSNVRSHRLFLNYRGKSHSNRMFYTHIWAVLLTMHSSQVAISAWLVAHYNTNHNFTDKSEQDRVRFLLFTSSWTVIFGAAYMGLFLYSPSGSPVTSVLSHGVLYVLMLMLWGTAELIGLGLACSLRGYSGQLVLLLSHPPLEEG